MDQNADTPDVPANQDDPSVPTAGAQEPMIPKHRLDELSQQVRQLREESAMKDELLRRMMPQQQPQGRKLPTAEELGLDQASFEAVSRLSKAIVEADVKPAFERMANAVASAHEKSDEAEFLLQYGPEKRDLLPAIRQFRKDYMNKYGGICPIEHAYILVREQQSARSGARQPAANPPSAQGPAQPRQAGPAGGQPQADHTRSVPRGSAVAQPISADSGTLDQFDVEAFEAQAEEQYFSQGKRL